MLHRHFLSLAIACVAVQLVPTASAVADWPYWRGADFTGHGYTTGLPDSWNPKKAREGNVLWSSDKLGSRSTPVIFDGRLYTICRADADTPIEGEKVVCVNAATGETVWENKFPVYLSDVPPERLGWSSVVVDTETANVYVLGVCDTFSCLDGKTGKIIWSIPLHEQFGMLSTYGGRTNFPIVFEDLVIISGVCTNWSELARPNHRLLAFNKKTGEMVWFSGTTDLPADTTYSGPSIASINGQQTILLGCGDGDIWGFQPRTGRALWHYDLSLAGVYSTPLVVDNTIFCAHAEENPAGSNMGAVAAFAIEGVGAETKLKELWRNENVMVGRCAPTYIDGRVYVIDDRCKLWIYDAKTGEPVAERISIGDRKQWASMLYADGKLHILTENGFWVIAKPTADGIEMLDKGTIRGESFVGSPITSDGRLYFPGSEVLYCVQGEQPGKVGTAPKRPEELPPAKNPEAAWVQITPCEVLMQPGEKKELKVSLFNAVGQPLGEANLKDVTFSVQGAGEVKDGIYTAPAGGEHTTAIVTAEVKGVKGMARLRVVPPLPWKFDFDKLKDAPSTWVGARYRHVIRPVEGNQVLVKVTTIPKGTRSRAWFGPSNLSNYTISCDVFGKRTDDQLPDIGLVAQGYTLDMQGNSQELQIRSWDPVAPIARTGFKWKENTWYRMKLSAQVTKDGDRDVAIIKGKVWPRGDAEPNEWTLEGRHEFPVTAGSPGLFGSSKVSELYLDNLEVVPNN